jgi:hypothetical protein
MGLAMTVGGMAAIFAGALVSTQTDRVITFMGGTVVVGGIVVLILGGVIWFSAGQLAD